MKFEWNYSSTLFVSCKMPVTWNTSWTRNERTCNEWKTKRHDLNERQSGYQAVVEKEHLESIINLL